MFIPAQLVAMDLVDWKIASQVTDKLVDDAKICLGEGMGQVETIKYLAEPPSRVIFSVRIAAVKMAREGMLIEEAFELLRSNTSEGETRSLLEIGAGTDTKTAERIIRKAYVLLAPVRK